MRQLAICTAIVLSSIAAIARGADTPPPAVAPATPVTTAASFPDDWFFYGEKRPAALRKLEGKPAPTLVGETWIGDAVDPAEHRGKVIILDFWGTWCPPCRKAIPKNIELVEKFKDQDLLFIAVHDARRGWDAAPGMAKQTGMNYPVALDKTGDDGVGISTKAFSVSFWPTYIAIDRRGVVRAAGLQPGRVEAVVTALLAEPKPEPEPTTDADAAAKTPATGAGA
jgi:thiol-disulfide isomerase/thioredoxin